MRFNTRKYIKDVKEVLEYKALLGVLEWDADNMLAGHRIKYHRAIDLWWTVKTIANMAICEAIGHKWEDHSVATPEYGNIDMVCVRCGISHFQYLY